MECLGVFDSNPSYIGIHFVVDKRVERRIDILYELWQEFIVWVHSMREKVTIQALLVESLALTLSFNVTAGMIVSGIAAALGGISLIFSVFVERPTATMLSILNYIAQIIGWISILIYIATVTGWL